MLCVVDVRAAIQRPQGSAYGQSEIESYLASCRFTPTPLWALPFLLSVPLVACCAVLVGCRTTLTAVGMPFRVSTRPTTHVWLTQILLFIVHLCICRVHLLETFTQGCWCP